VNFKNRVLLVYVVLVVTVTALPAGNAHAFFTGSDKVAHGLMFLVLGVLSSWTVPKKHVMVITGSLFLAVVTEVLQLAVPQRSFEWLDLAADGVGVLVGWGAYQVALAVGRGGNSER